MDGLLQPGFQQHSPRHLQATISIWISYISRFYLVWFPVFYGKKKVARQLVALCLVSSLGHNTCVFLSDQPDIPCCQAVAGDVVLNLRRHGNK